MNWPTLTMIAVMVGLIPTFWRVMLRVGERPRMPTIEAPLLAKRVPKQQQEETKESQWLEEIPQSSEDSELLAENFCKARFAESDSAALATSDARLAVGWRTRPASASRLSLKNVGVEWGEYPAAAFQSLVEFDAELWSDPVYSAHIHDTLKTCLLYRKAMLWEYYYKFDPIIQRLLLPYLAPGTQTREVSDVLKEVQDFFGDLDNKWESAFLLYPRTSDQKLELSDRSWEALEHMAYSEILSGATLDAVEQKFAALNVAIQEKVMISLMQSVNRYSPHELSIYLRSLPPDVPWRAVGISTLLSSLDAKSEEYQAWAKQLSQ